MSFAKYALASFMTEMNVKNFVFYMFDNNFLNNKHCIELFKSSCNFSRSSRTHPNDTFYGFLLYCWIVYFVNKHNSSVDVNLLKSLYLFPDFLNHFKIMTKLNKKQQKIMAKPIKKHLMNQSIDLFTNNLHLVVNNVAKIESFTKSEIEIIINQLTRVTLFDGDSYNDFLTDTDNVKQFMIAIFETPNNNDSLIDRYLFAIFYRDFMTDVSQKKPFSSIYESFGKHLTNLNCNKVHVSLCGCEYYNKFVIKHVFERKMRIMWLSENIYNNYEPNNMMHAVFADEFIVKGVCGFL